MFKFNFSSKEGEISEKVKESEDSNTEGDKLEWFLSQEVSYEKYKDIIKIPEKWGLLNMNGHELYYILPSEINSFIESNKSLLPADIIPAKYEGGLKIWDTTYHLIDFLTNSTCDITLKNKKVLDVGCGNGILGITAAALGACSIFFQDYNEDVIKIATIPSVLKNFNKLNISETNCKFYSGDWMSFSELIKNEFDVILTSATIYNTSNYKKLLSVFRNGLKPDGIILVAAKTYYFGHGGGTRQFEEALKSDGNFTSEVLWTTTEGVKQEILKVNFQIK